MRAVLFDMGGVLTTSPFENFAALERRRGLPEGFLVHVNSTDPDGNAWARFERGELDQPAFVTAFEAEAAANGHPVDGHEVLGCLDVSLRPEMVDALRVCAANFATALLTNNFISGADASEFGQAVAEVHALFDVVVESTKTGVRKPDPRFYEIACELLDVEPVDCVFLDDLGINLKPARDMGMITIKVDSPQQALHELAAVTGLSF